QVGVEVYKDRIDNRGFARVIGHAAYRQESAAGVASEGSVGATFQTGFGEGYDNTAPTRSVFLVPAPGLSAKTSFGGSIGTRTYDQRTAIPSETLYLDMLDVRGALQYCETVKDGKTHDLMV